MTLVPGTLAARLYGAVEAAEDYYCNYGVNPEYHQRLEDGGLRISGVGAEGEIRIVEIPVRAHRATASRDARSAPSRPVRG